MDKDHNSRASSEEKSSKKLPILPFDARSFTTTTTSGKSQNSKRSKQTNPDIVSHETIEQGIRDALEEIYVGLSKTSMEKEIFDSLKSKLQSIYLEQLHSLENNNGFVWAPGIKLQMTTVCLVKIYDLWMQEINIKLKNYQCEFGVVMEHFKNAHVLLFQNLSPTEDAVQRLRFERQQEEHKEQLSKLQDHNERDISKQSILESVSMNQRTTERPTDPNLLAQLYGKKNFEPRQLVAKLKDKERIHKIASKYLPVIRWLPLYTTTKFREDLIAGISTGIMMIAQCMAYALLAGLPPIYGLYTVFLAPFFYAPFGTGMQMHIGPLAIVSLLVGQTIQGQNPSSQQEVIELCKVYAFYSGLLMFLLGLFKFGFLINFLSKPVLSGYTSAASIIIALSQLQHFFGIKVPNTPLLHVLLEDFFNKIQETNPYAVLLGCVSFAILMLFKKWKRISKIPKTNIPFPSILLVCLISILFAWGANIAEVWHVRVIGFIPSGLPSFSAPKLDAKSLSAIPAVFAIVLAGFMETTAIGAVQSARDGTYKIDTNQELIAVGLTNIFGSLFLFYPAFGAIGRGAVHIAAGAKTPIAAVVSACVLGLTLEVLTPLFTNLPLAVLASIVMVAAIGLVDYEEPIKLWKVSKKETLLLFIAFFLTLFLGVEIGIITAVAASLIHEVYMASRPHTAVLGRLPGTVVYRNIARFPEAITQAGVIVFRFDGPIFFGNVKVLSRKLQKIERIFCQNKTDPLQGVVLDANPINNIDSTAISALKDIVTQYSKRNIIFCIAGIKGKALRDLQRGGFVDLVGEDHFFYRVHDAVNAILEGKITSRLNEEPSFSFVAWLKELKNQAMGHNSETSSNKNILAVEMA